MVTVISRYVVADGHVPAVRQLLARNAAASRAQPGCLEFSVYQQLDDPRARARPRLKNTGEARTSSTSSKSRWFRFWPNASGAGWIHARNDRC